MQSIDIFITRAQKKKKDQQKIQNIIKTIKPSA